MCYSLHVSLAAGFYGVLASLYLHNRNFSARDAWYAQFLMCFTMTQFFDAYIWSLEDPNDPRTLFCDGTMNLLASKYVLPIIVFAQPIVLTFYPPFDLKTKTHPSLPVARQTRSGKVLISAPRIRLDLPCGLSSMTPLRSMAQLGYTVVSVLGALLFMYLIPGCTTLYFGTNFFEQPVSSLEHGGIVISFFTFSMGCAW